MSNTNCKIDFMNKEIQITKRFYKESQAIGTEAFRTMLDLQAKLPSFRIRLQEVPKCHPYMPTYYQMEDTIRAIAQDPDVELREWEHVRNMARLTGQGYNMVRRWFVEKYGPDRIGVEKEYRVA